MLDHRYNRSRPTAADIERLLDLPVLRCDHALVRLTLVPGLRAGEIVRLRRRDIDFAAGVIHVRWGKCGEHRTACLDPGVADALRDMLAEQDGPWNPRFPAGTRGAPETAHLFVTRWGAPYTADGVKERLARLSECVCGRRISFHAVRQWALRSRPELGS